MPWIGTGKRWTLLDAYNDLRGSLIIKQLNVYFMMVWVGLFVSLTAGAADGLPDDLLRPE